VYMIDGCTVDFDASICDFWATNSTDCEATFFDRRHFETVGFGSKCTNREPQSSSKPGTQRLLKPHEAALDH